MSSDEGWQAYSGRFGVFLNGSQLLLSNSQRGQRSRTAICIYKSSSRPRLHLLSCSGALWQSRHGVVDASFLESGEQVSVFLVATLTIFSVFNSLACSLVFTSERVWMRLCVLLHPRRRGSYFIFSFFTLNSLVTRWWWCIVWLHWLHATVWGNR